ncbi:MAG TPA: hypothetical protein IAA75_08945 [Candidatus Pullichristensenella avicola]|nr:hypothetical protein [Candidatus Pullichristensenella avicola]
MTRKRQIFVAQLAAGSMPEDAARAAGYTPAYAAALAARDDVQEVVKRRRAYIDAMRERRNAEGALEGPREPGQVLEELAYDELQDPRVRIAAVRALSQLHRNDESGEPRTVIILDDVLCQGCDKRPI